MKKLTLKIKKNITNQWRESFPSMGIYKNMWILRRVGPFLQGICLDKDTSNSSYLPTFHIHNLVNQDDDFISLTLRTPLMNTKSGAPLHISIAQHEDYFSDYVTKFRQQVPLTLDGGLSCHEFLHVFKNYINNGQAENRYPLPLYFDMTCLLIWCGKPEASLLFDEVSQKIKSWPNDVTKYMEQSIKEFHGLKAYLNNPTHLKNQVNSAVEHLELTMVPSIDITE